MGKDTSFWWLLNVTRSEVSFRSIIVCGATDEAALLKLEVEVALDLEVCDAGIHKGTNETRQYKL
jgi:hypothetical protein